MSENFASRLKQIMYKNCLVQKYIQGTLGYFYCLLENQKYNDVFHLQAVNQKNE